ncbi:MAG: hypothetical protein JXR78_09365 [Victivallales bacterium]|nr:hypothetical protein [Victivallales bacterium]
MSDVEKRLADYIDVEVRLDDHPPIGPHINVESVIDLEGAKEGRQMRITNNHVPFDISKS